MNELIEKRICQLNGQDVLIVPAARRLYMAGERDTFWRIIFEFKNSLRRIKYFAIII
jgi:hypothetical protein